MGWENYHKLTGESAPRPKLVEAMKYVKERGAALELGAGALFDTRFLLKSGFERIVAVDKTIEVQDGAREIRDDRLTVVISSFEDFEFPEEEFDLVNAQFSLPFVSRGEFDRVFKEVKDSLKEGGIFSGQLFGTRDEWASDPNRTFHTEEEARKLFEDMQLIDFQEIEKDAPTATGEMKHWHIFDFISEK